MTTVPNTKAYLPALSAQGLAAKKEDKPQPANEKQEKKDAGLNSSNVESDPAQWNEAWFASYE